MGGYFHIKDTIDFILERKMFLYKTMDNDMRKKICFLCGKKIDFYDPKHPRPSIYFSGRYNKRYFVHHNMDKVPLCNPHMYDLHWNNVKINPKGFCKQNWNVPKTTRRMEHSERKVYNYLGHYFFGQKNLRIWRKNLLLQNDYKYDKVYRQ